MKQVVAVLDVAVKMDGDSLRGEEYRPMQEVLMEIRGEMKRLMEERYPDIEFEVGYPR